MNTLKTSLEEAVESAKQTLGAANVAIHPVLENLLAVSPSVTSLLHEWELVKGESYGVR